VLIRTRLECLLYGGDVVLIEAKKPEGSGSCGGRLAVTRCVTDMIWYDGLY